MVYTRVWSDTSPSGAALANTADDEIRNLRLDVHERMDTILGAVWNTDPVVDWTVSKTLFIPVWAGIKGADTGVGLLDNNLGFSLTNVGNAIIFVPIILPVGVTVTNIKVPYVLGASQTMDIKFTTVGGANLGSLTVGPSAAGDADLGVLAQVIGTLTYYGVSIKLTAAGFPAAPHASGVQVSYKKANLLAGF